MKKDSVLRWIVIVYALSGTGIALHLSFAFTREFGNNSRWVASSRPLEFAYYLNAAFFCGLLGFSIGYRLLCSADPQPPRRLRAAGTIIVFVWAAILIQNEIRFPLLSQALAPLFD